MALLWLELAVRVNPPRFAPIVFWDPADALQALGLENGSRANSYVPTVPDPRATATALAQTIHC